MQHGYQSTFWSGLHRIIAFLRGARRIRLQSHHLMHAWPATSASSMRAYGKRGNDSFASTWWPVFVHYFAVHRMAIQLPHCSFLACGMRAGIGISPRVLGTALKISSNTHAYRVEYRCTPQAFVPDTSAKVRTCPTPTERGPLLRKG